VDLVGLELRFDQGRAAVADPLERRLAALVRRLERVAVDLQAFRGTRSAVGIRFGSRCGNLVAGRTGSTAADIRGS